MELAVRMKGKPKKDLSKFKCFNCGDMGHFPLRFLMKGDDEKRKGKKVVSFSTSTEIDDLSGRLQGEEFSTISHLS